MEQPLPPYGSCLLGSINLAAYVIDPFTPVADFNMKQFNYDCEVFNRMLDNVVELNGLRLPEQVHEITYKRRHGMGFMGLGSALNMMGIPYGSEKAIQFAETIAKTMAIQAFITNVQLAKEKGCAPFFKLADGSDNLDKTKVASYLNTPYIQRVTDLLYLTTTDVDYGQLAIDAKLYGLRYTHATSIAPTGTISAGICNNVSNGIEPSFSHDYGRNMIVEGKKSKKYLPVYSYEYLLYRHLYGDVPVPETFNSAMDLPVQAHIDIQAAVQPWVDSSISKTVNVPDDIPYDDFKEVYMLAYNKGLKGCTTFRRNPEVFQGVLITQNGLQNTVYCFTLEDGSTVEVSGDTIIDYDDEEHTAANLFDALKEGYYGKF